MASGPTKLQPSAQGYDFFDKSCIEVAADDIDRFLNQLKLVS